MNIRTGIDIVEIKRIRQLLKDQDQVERTFDHSEISDNPAESIAGIFALKEAFFKASQIKVKNWKEIVVKKERSGKPYIVFDENLIDFNINSIDCSISHDGEYAVAYVAILVE